MQESRRQGNSSDAGITGNTDQPQVQSSHGGVKLLTSPIIAAVLTAATSLIVFTFNQVKTIDARLDELEKEARLLLSTDGTAAASPEALESFYGLKAVEQRLDRVEEKLHFHADHSGIY
jgi:uncharacterized protein HemX